LSNELAEKRIRRRIVRINGMFNISNYSGSVEARLFAGVGQIGFAMKWAVDGD
jgi:hypothetical protein